MQHLEVSGAVRPLYGSLGVKMLKLVKHRELKTSAVSVLHARTHTHTRARTHAHTHTHTHTRTRTLALVGLSSCIKQDN
jgi:hypothetical protein